MPSVTEILSTFPERELVEWQLRVGPKKAKEVSEEALRIGKAVDLMIQEDYRTRIPQLGLSIDPSIQNCLRGWNEFIVDYPDFYDEVINLQQELIRDGIVGHPDFRLLRQRKRGIVDLKCATQIRPGYWTQTGGYSWLENDEDNVDFLGILRLDKVTGSYEYVELTDPDEIDY